MATFKSVQFMEALDKARVARNWDKFLREYVSSYDKTYIDRFGNEMDLPFKYFTKALYNHLHLHCGYIAHYDILGFYHAQLSNPLSVYNNLLRIASGIAGNEDYADLNNAMAETAKKYLPAIKKMIEDRANEAQKENIAEAKDLLQANGYSVATK